MRRQTGYVVHRDDNVGTAVTALFRGLVALISDHPLGEIELKEDIPLGHKFALRDIPSGSPIVKYGVCIGTSTADMRRGEHVHLHNMRSNFDERSSNLDVVTAKLMDVEYRLHWGNGK